MRTDPVRVAPCAALGAIAFAVAGCGEAKQAGSGRCAAAGRDRRPGRWSKIIGPRRRFTGRVEAGDKVDLRARVDGFLEKRLFNEGADVKEGDLLFVIEKGLYQAAVDEAKAGDRHGRGDAQAGRDRGEAPDRAGAEAAPRRRRGSTRPSRKQRRGAAAKLLAAQGRPGEGRAQLELHRHHGADRRPHRPRRLFGRQFRRRRRAARWRRSSARIRST